MTSCLVETVASDVKQARKLLKENKSQSQKTVLLTKWENVSNVSRCEFDASDAHDKGSHQGVTTETSVIDSGSCFELGYL